MLGFGWDGRESIYPSKDLMVWQPWIISRGGTGQIWYDSGRSSLATVLRGKMRLRSVINKEAKAKKEITDSRQKKRGGCASEMIKYYPTCSFQPRDVFTTVRYYFNTQVPIKFKSCLPPDDDVEWLHARRWADPVARCHWAIPRISGECYLPKRVDLCFRCVGREH